MSKLTVSIILCQRSILRTKRYVSGAFGRTCEFCVMTISCCWPRTEPSVGHSRTRPVWPRVKKVSLPGPCPEWVVDSTERAFGTGLNSSVSMHARDLGSTQKPRRWRHSLVFSFIDLYTLPQFTFAVVMGQRLSSGNRKGNIFFGRPVILCFYICSIAQ
jgi:hypothetical protein